MRPFPRSKTTSSAIEVPQSGSSRDLQSRVLILAPFGDDAEYIRRVLGQSAIPGTRCADGTELCAEIDRGAAAAVITQEALTPDTRDVISSALAQQPSWSEVPLIVLGSHGSTQSAAWKELDNLWGTSHLTLIQRPITVATLVTVVRTALSARDKQYQIRDEIAARELVEEALRQSEAKYRSMFENMGEGFNLIEIIKDDCGNVIDGRFLEVNPASEKHTGIVSDEVIGRRLSDVYPKLEGLWWDAIKSVTDTGEPVQTEYYNNDTHRYFDISLFALTPNRVCGLFRDVTRRKQSEHTLRDLNRTLEEKVAERTEVAERRAADLSRMAAELSMVEQTQRKRLAKILHDDLQQILLASIWRLHALECANEAQREGKADVEKLLNDCLQSSRSLSHELSPPVLELGTLDEIFRWVGNWAYDKFGLNVTVDCCDDPEVMPQHLRTFLYEAVRELLVNTVKHSGQFRARVTVRNHDGALHVIVEDYGQGFDPRQIERHLDNPETFGLYRVRNRLQAMQGRFDVAKNGSGGAQIRIVIPLDTTDANKHGDDAPRIELSEDVSAAKDERPHEQIRVLVVDDHTVVRQGLVQLLQKDHHFVVVGEAADGKEAVAAAARLQPDVVIMDISMPNMNGIQATRHIKRDFPSMVVVGLSLHDKGSVAQSMANAGATAYVRKDAPADELIDTIRLACEMGE